MAPLKAKGRGETRPLKIEVAIEPTVREPQIKATTGRNLMVSTTKLNLFKIGRVFIDQKHKGSAQQDNTYLFLSLRKVTKTTCSVDGVVGIQKVHGIYLLSLGH